MSVGRFYDEIDEIIDNMAEYLGVEEEDDFYDEFFEEDEDDDLIDDTAVTMEDVEKVGITLEKYIDELVALSKNADDEKIMKAVEKTVKKLNKQNEACECELIEDETSEEICRFIHEAAVEAGLVDVPENVCDEWREF